MKMQRQMEPAICEFKSRIQKATSISRGSKQVVKERGTNYSLDISENEFNKIIKLIVRCLNKHRTEYVL